LPELLAIHLDIHSGKAPVKPIYRAQSWIVTHYLISQDKLSETGAYFGMAQMQGTPIEQAIQKAYGVSSAQLEQAIKEHLRSFGAPQSSLAKSAAAFGSPGAKKFNPVGPLNIGTSYKPVPLPEAQSLIAEMKVRVPEHRQAALDEVKNLSNDPKTENSIQYRTQAWVSMQENKTDDATEEFQKAIELNVNDPWTHYYFARMKYRTALASGNTFPGLANMLINLRTVLDWDSDFAEAYNMLAMGRVEGGGTNSAVEVIRKAVELSPRNEMYLLNMGLVNMAAKNWDAATALLERLKTSRDPVIAADARDYLDQMPNVKKYGMLPQRAVVKTGPVKPLMAKPKVENNDEDADARPAPPPPDKRKVQFLRGKLLRVDCSSAPAALLSVASSAKTWRLRTEDYHSLLLLGANEFSCEWANLPVMVNYKAGGKSDGDVVSLEIRHP
jgi:Tfp pilus assembly protein PilF